MVISVLVVLLALFVLSSFKNAAQHGQKEIVVYCVQKQKAISFITDKTMYYCFDTSLLYDRNNMLFHIYHHWWESGIAEQVPLSENVPSKPGISLTRIITGQIVLFEGKKILLVDSNSIANPYGAKIKLKPDLVIISGSPGVSIPVLKKAVDFDEVVFDSSTKSSNRKRWKKDCSDLNINFWDVNTDGAYVWDLNTEAP